jgi:hypothetical protein
MGTLLKRREASLVAAVAATFLMLATLGVGPTPAGGQTPQADGEPAQLAKDLIGTWAYAGTPEEIVEPPEKGARLKFFTGRHWTITHPDAETGAVGFHHGGTYALEGDKYVETIEYATEGTADLIGQAFTFTIKVDGDTYTQTGVGNPYNEVWKRLK